jgi:hypothetical protein
MRKYLKLILTIGGSLVFLGLIGFIAIQFVPVDRSNPPVVGEPRWNSPQTRALAERACYDCHSNETKWPWYTNIAPVSWLAAHDVEEGRAALNFSEWGVSRGEESEGAAPDEIVEEVEEGKMPLPKYLLLHPEARLTAMELQALINGLKATFDAGRL